MPNNRSDEAPERLNMQKNVIALQRIVLFGEMYCGVDHKKVANIMTCKISKFLGSFKKTQKNVYQIYHSSIHFDSKKIYRYIRYSIKAELLEIDHIVEDKFLPSKDCRLSQKGRALVTLFS